MKESQEIEVRFNHYWELLGKSSADTFIACKLVPNEECFKGMLRCAYSMGWSEALLSRTGDYPTPSAPPRSEE
jgi:hypothetical protein